MLQDLGLIHSEPVFACYLSIPPFWEGNVHAVLTCILRTDLILQGLCLSFCRCDKTPRQKQLEREKVYCGPQFHSIMVRKIGQQECAGRHSALVWQQRAWN